MNAPRHVAVIGAGVVGCCSAIELLRAGHRVTLLDPGPPGGEQAASFGNAGWFSSMSVLPYSEPGLWRKLPGFLADPLGPLAIRWSHFPRALPWLLRFLAAGWTEDRVIRIATTLRSLAQDSAVLHTALAAEAGVPELVEHRGVFYAYPSRADYEAEAMGWRIRRQLGISWQELSGAELHAAEPNLDAGYGFGVLIGEAGRCLNPGRYVAALATLAQARGAAFRPIAATGFHVEAGRLRGVTLGDGTELACDAAVICCGARSRGLAAAAGDDVLLEAERGYHVMLHGAEQGSVHSIGLSDAKMVVNPMQDGLRAAGQVEIAALDAPPDWRRANILRDHLLRAFPHLPNPFPPERVTMWLGNRPGTPDGLACIGPSSATSDIVHAFGHGHGGMVAGPRTGRLVAQLLSGLPPEIPLDGFNPRRFR